MAHSSARNIKMTNESTKGPNPLYIHKTPTRVNTQTTGWQDAPKVAIAADDSFVLVRAADNPAPDRLDIYARRFDANGISLSPIGP